MNLDNSPTDLEVRRIARLVGVEPAELVGLEAAPLTDLRTLREQIASRLFDEGADSWERAAAVAGVVPSGLAAKLAQGALGPVLAARVTSAVDVKRAVDISTRLPPSFMADTAVNIDPRQVTELVVHLPPRTIAEVGEELAARGEWLVMADFVAAITLTALQTTVEGLDEAAILRIAVLLEQHDRIDAVCGMLDDARLLRLCDVTAAEGLAAHLAFVLDAVGEDQRARLQAAGA